MKIIMIRHGKVNMEWDSSYDSEGFDEAQRRYDISPLNDFGGKVAKAEGYKVYISDLSRTYDTALQIFGGEEGLAKCIELVKTPLLNEVPKRSYKDTKSKHAKGWWTMRSRIQWFFNSSRQPETKKDTKIRAKKAADLIEQGNADAVVISHEFFLYSLKGEFEKRGYVIERSEMFRIKNWERIRASKRDMHCGGCSHNCLLTSPGCDVGRDAAKMKEKQPL